MRALMFFVAVLFATGVVYGERIYQMYLDSNGNQITKRDAVKSLLLNDQATIWDCKQVELSDRITLIRKKKKK